MIIMLLDAIAKRNRSHLVPYELIFIDMPMAVFLVVWTLFV